MKYLSINEFKNMEDFDLLDRLIDQRADEFLKHLSTALKGQTIQGFGAQDHSLWGQHDTTQIFKIKSIKRESTCDAQVNFNRDAIPDKIYLSVNVELTGYNPDKTGLLYTSNLAEKDIKTHLTELLGKQASINWSEQGMQDYNNTVNFDMTIKPELIIQDYVDYCKFLHKVKKLEQNAVVPEHKVEDDFKKLFKPK